MTNIEMNCESYKSSQDNYTSCFVIIYSSRYITLYVHYNVPIYKTRGTMCLKIQHNVSIYNHNDEIPVLNEC